MTQQVVSFAVEGGMDLVTAPAFKPPGRVINALNYEPVAAGYRRLRGYERFDGQIAPSDATYARIDFTNGGFTGQAEPSPGNDLFQTNATNKCFLLTSVTTGGTWAGGDASGYFVVTIVSGSFAAGTIKQTAGASPVVADIGAAVIGYDFGEHPELISNTALSSDWTLHDAGQGEPEITGDGLVIPAHSIGIVASITAEETLTAAEYIYSITILSGTDGHLDLRLGGDVLVDIDGQDTITPGTFEGRAYAAPASDLIELNATFGTDDVTVSRVSVRKASSSDYRALASASARSRIAAVSGSGSVRGITIFEEEVLAFRDDAGATAGVMFKASATGWDDVPTLVRIDFTSDTATQTLPALKPPAPPTAPQTIANVSSGSSDGTIRSVTITSTVGTVNTGFMLISGYNAGSWTTGGQTIYQATTATQFGTTTAAPVTPVIAAGGRYFFTDHNFYGAADYQALYAVNGVGQAIVYDGTGFANISTGMPEDKPTRVADHRNSLFLAFPGGSIQFSAVGEPTIFDPILGAGEIGVGHEVTDFIAANQGTLAIFTEHSINILYGNDSTDYTLEILNEQAGAQPYTAQRLGQVLYMDNRGIRTLSASQQFGNFQAGTISRLVAPLIEEKMRDGIHVIASFLARARDQYWVVYDDGTGLIVYMGKKNPEIMPFDLDLDITCACSGEIDGLERIFVGTSDGFVYEMDKGTSFDGDPISHELHFSFYTFGTPQQQKRLHKITADMVTEGDVTLNVSIHLDSGSVTSIPEQELVITTGHHDFGYGEAYIDGVASNAAAVFSGETDDEDAHVLTGITYHVSGRNLRR